MTEADLSPVPIPIGVIAAGSTNALAYTLHGTDDPVTATIHIVLGGCTNLDVVSVQNHSGIERFVLGQLSYGYLADTLLHSERLRWMGPKRYNYAGLCQLLSHATYDGVIDIKQTTNEPRKPPSMCRGGVGCEDCDNDCDYGRPKAQSWKKIEGNFIGISAANISLKCPMSPMGMAPFAHLSDGCMELILVRKATRMDHLRYLLRTAGDSRTAFTLPYVERYRVKEFVFTPATAQDKEKRSNAGIIKLDGAIGMSDVTLQEFKGIDNMSLGVHQSHSVWNCDGELLFQPSVKVTVHSNLVRIFARKEGQNGISVSSTSSTTLSSMVPVTRSPSVETQGPS
jgi:ceramide kinase